MSTTWACSDVRFEEISLCTPTRTYVKLSAWLKGASVDLADESLFLGFPAMFHTINNHSDGFDAIELTSSRDLRHWNRVGDR